MLRNNTAMSIGSGSLFDFLLGHLCTTTGNLALDGGHLCTTIGNLDLSPLTVGVTDVEFSSVSMNLILPSVSGNTLG